MRRYVAGHRFWEIAIDGATLTTRWGTVGARGQTRTTECRSVARAKREYHVRVRDKERDGYQLVETVPVTGRKRAVATGPESRTAPTSERAADAARLEDAIRTAVDDDGPFLVYGDWLAEHGDPRGELVALHARGTPAAAQRFLAKHPDLWGGLDELRDVVTEVAWRLGFIDAARVGNTADRVLLHEQASIPDVVSRLLDGPGRFLRTLTIGLGSRGAYDAGCNTWYTDVVETLAAAPRPTLRALAIGILRKVETKHTSTGIGALEHLCPQLPNLERLWLAADHLAPGELDLPSLRECTLHTRHASAELAKLVAAARWPRLAKLSLKFSAGNTRPEMLPHGTAANLSSLFDALPPLRELAIHNFESPAWLLERLAASPVAHSLHTLDLAGGTFGDADARKLVDMRGAWPQLSTLRLAQNALTDAGLALLAQHWQVAGERQRPLDSTYGAF